MFAMYKSLGLFAHFDCPLICASDGEVSSMGGSFSLSRPCKSSAWQPVADLASDWPRIWVLPPAFMTIVRRVMALPTPPAQRVESLGLDDFAFRHGRTFSTVIVDLDAHQIIDLLPDRQAET